MTTMVSEVQHRSIAIPVTKAIWMVGKRFWIIASMLVIVLMFACGVVYTKDINRHYFAELQSLQKTRDAMQIEWGQLLLEQSTWGSQSRVQQIAMKRFKMHSPDKRTTVKIKQTL